MRALLFFLAFVKTLWASPSFYVIGEDSVLFHSPTISTTILSGVSAESWALDEAQCRLWITSTSQKELLTFEKGEKIQSESFEGKIVSDFSEGIFATLSQEGQIQMRNKQGAIFAQFFMEDFGNLSSIAFLTSGEAWSLFQKRSGDLWLKRLDTEGQEQQNILLPPTDEFWGNARLFLNEKRNQMWLGYSSRSPHHSYAPIAVEFSLQGVKKRTHQWDERGFFFDGCVNSEGDLLLARDLPTAPYTVPDYSFIERVKSFKKNSFPVERVLELETNRLVDSMACKGNTLYLATHSIFGTEPKQILRWSLNQKEKPEVLLNLPSRPRRILVCF